MKKTRKAIALLLAAFMTTMSLAGCAASGQTSQPAPKPAAESTAEEARTIHLAIERSRSRGCLDRL